MPKNTVELDEIDRSILNILLKNANTSYVDIARKIHVSAGTVHVRMKNLIAAGIVKNAVLNVDYARLGFTICAFIGIHLEKSNKYPEVVNELYKIPEVVNVHYTTGNFNIFVKIICRDTAHLHEIMQEGIQQIEGIQRSESFLSLDESISRSIVLTDE
jgi:Lrp/AsnC family transcriptional regulator for asnA, asnC and gidA